MTREFIMMPQFDKQWKAIGLDDSELKQLQENLLLNPQAGAVVEGTGGLRKVRFSANGKGKKGALRIVYVDFTTQEKIYLIHAYSKSEKDNLSKEERNNIKKLIECLEKNI